MVTHISQQLLAVAAFLSGAVALGKLVDSWMVPREKLRLKERTIAVWFDFGSQDALSVIQTPLRFMAKILESIYGPSIFSWKALSRSTLVSFILLVASLGVTGIMTGEPFAIHSPPWKSFEDSFAMIDTTLNSDALKAQWKKEENKAGQKLILKAAERMKVYHTSQNKVLYNCFFVLFVLLLNSIMDFGCLVVARLTLLDMVRATTITTLASLALTNGIAFLIVYSTFLTGVAAAAMPLTWVIVWLLFWIVKNIGWAIGVCFLVPAEVAAMVLSPSWIQVAAVNAAMPGLLVVFLSLLALSCFPFRRTIHNVILKLLDRATMHETGVLGFATIVAATMIVVISGLAYLMIKGPLI